MNLRRYWPTALAFAYCGLAAFLFLPVEHINSLNDTVLFLFVLPFNAILIILPDPYRLRLLSIGDQLLSPNPLGWFFVSLVIVGLVFTANHFITEWWSRRGTSKSTKS